MGRLAAPAEIVIDLGEIAVRSPIRRLPDPDDGPPRSGRGLLLLFAVLLAAVIVGDTPRVPLRDVIVVPAEHSEFDLTGDVLYVLRGASIPNQVVAYGLREGRQMWQRESPANTAYSHVYRVGDRTLLVPNPCLTTLPVMTVAVDTRTGREVWRRPGVPERVVVGAGLVVMSRAGPTSTCATGYPSGNPSGGYWDGVDTRTGAVVWSAETPPRARISFDSDDASTSRRGVSVARDGTVTSTDLRTGGITGRIGRPELAVPAQPAIGAAAAATLTVIGDQVLVLERAKTTQTAAVLVEITAYDAGTLARRWSAQADAGPAATRPGATAVVLSGCGPMLCLGGPQRTVFLDPDTGGERWRTGLSLVAVQDARALLADPDATGGEVPLGGLTVRDVRTGQPRGDLPGWRLLNDAGSSAQAPVLGRTIGDRTWLAPLDLGQGWAATVGSAPGTYSSCIDSSGYLGCRRIDGSVQVWRTPTA
jgi:outer membrane protein assembly factor BamB